MSIVSIDRDELQPSLLPDLAQRFLLAATSAVVMTAVVLLSAVESIRLRVGVGLAFVALFICLPSALKAFRQVAVGIAASVLVSSIVVPLMLALLAIRTLSWTAARIAVPLFVWIGMLALTAVVPTLKACGRVAARFVMPALIGIMLAMGVCSSAKAWWNDQWQLRKKITIDTSATGANITDPIGTAPVLIRLHVGNFRFASAKDDGSDLRFVAGDDKTPLKYHIEKYDSLLDEGLVWVSVPNVKPGAKTDIWLYYGNKKAAAVSDAKATYDPDTLLVYHFNEHGTPALDSSVWGNNAQSVGVFVDGSIIGRGLKLDGHAPLTLPASPSLQVAAGGAFTLSLWVQPAALQANAVLYSRRDGANALIIGFDNGVPFVSVTNGGAEQRSAGGAPITAQSWHHLAVIADGKQITIDVDGRASTTLAATLPALNTVAYLGGDTAVAAAPAPAQPAPAPAQPAAVAGQPAPAAGTPAVSGNTPANPANPAAPGAPPEAQAAGAAPTPIPGAAPAAGTGGSISPGSGAVFQQPAPVASAAFVGDVDELEISKIARPAGFIKFAAIGQGADNAKLASYSVDEETGSWLSGYFAVILKSVTLDGWVVIGILVIMAVISWLVMIDKSSYLNRQAKANTRFLTAFRALSADLSLLDRGPAEEIATLGGRLSGPDGARTMRRSSLYRIYRLGGEDIWQRAMRHGGQSFALSAPAIAAIRATLDAAVIKEIQRLNRLMVVLTIAISGGPFLGLLGTVVGVMITFAAIAASGDVNVNAIAPGIAAALVATVTGLGVAIPALFGYNYLISKIKDLTADIQVFVDEFVTKLAELHSDERPDPIAHRMAAE